MRPFLSGMTVLGLAGCAGGSTDTLAPQSGTALEAFSYGWVLFNHRVSHLGVATDESGADVAIVGGTSTTSEITGLDQTCDPEGCSEFPFADRSQVDLTWSALASERTALAPFSVDLEVGADGVSSTVDVALPEGASGAATAVLAGFVLDTDHALSGGPACYDPRLGWHPRRLAFALGAPTVSDGSASVPVTAAFAAGNTFDPDRTCIDEVNEQAVVSLRIDGLLLVGEDLRAEDVPVTVRQDYPFSGDKLHPEEQPLPAPTAVDPAFEATVAGVAGVDFSFYPDATDGKGAYLRTLGFGVGASTAEVWATNWSPGTQLEDFSSLSTLTARFVAFDGEASSMTVSAELPTLLDDQGEPVVSRLEP